MAPIRTAALLAIALVAAACNGDTVHPLYSADPLAADNPLPDDRLLQASGLRLADRAGYWAPYVPTISRNPTLEGRYRDYATHLGSLGGWGPYAPILIGFDGALDAAAVTADRFAVVALDPPGLAPGFDPVWHADPGFVELRPRAPLAPGTRYGVAVLAGLDGAAAPADRDAAIAGEVATAAGLAAGDILLAFTLTTDRATDAMSSAAMILFDVVPTADFTAVPANPRWPRGVMTRDEFLATFAPGALHDELVTSLAHAGTIAIGTFPSMDFRAANGVFDPALIAGTAPAPTTDLEFVVVEPDRMRFPPPWPVTIIQHGFQGSSVDVLTRANAFNDVGIATIGIDAVQHGIRGNVSGFLDPSDLRKVRENFRQTVLDQIQLCRLAVRGGIDVSPPTAPDFDGRCFYEGQSMGGVIGGMYTALSPDVDVAVLNVAGGGLTRILQSSFLGGLIKLLFQPALGLTGDDLGWDGNLPFFTWIGQTILDSSDPINYGPLVANTLPGHPPRQVLIQAGVGDSLVPNDTSRALAASIGIPELTAPTLSATGVSGLWFVDLAEFGIVAIPGGDTEPHGILTLVPGVPRQAAHFMISGGTDVIDPATVNDPF